MSRLCTACLLNRICKPRTKVLASGRLWYIFSLVSMPPRWHADRCFRNFCKTIYNQVHIKIYPRHYMCSKELKNKFFCFLSLLKKYNNCCPLYRSALIQTLCNYAESIKETQEREVRMNFIQWTCSCVFPPAINSNIFLTGT